MIDPDLEIEMTENLVILTVLEVDPEIETMTIIEDPQAGTDLNLGTDLEIDLEKDPLPHTLEMYTL